ELLAIASQFQKNVSPQRMSGSDKAVSNPRAFTIRSLLHQPVFRPRFKIRNGNRTDAYIIEVPKRLLNDVRRRECRVVINGEYHVAFCEMRPFVATNNEAPGLVVTNENSLWEFRAYHVRCSIGRAIV